MEIWDVYDQDRTLTGKTVIRGATLDDGILHLVVHVCIFHSSSQMLIQQRQPFKDGWPNRWDISVGGSAVSGDSSQAAAEREVLEELGYQLHLENVRPSLTINFDHGFDDVYLVEADVDLDSLRLQEQEVQRVKWATREEVLAMIDCGEFIPYHKSFIALLFDMRKQMGGVNWSAV